MNLGIYTNGFNPGDRVRINVPMASFDGLETEVVRPRVNDDIGPDDVLVKDPVSGVWVLRLHRKQLVKLAVDAGFAAAAGL